MKISKHLRALLILATTTLFLVACGGAEEPTVDTEPETVEEEQAAAESNAVQDEEAMDDSNDSEVVIEWFHIWANEANIADPFQELADEFMAENPNVTIEITMLENEAYKQKMTTLMQSNDPPDVFQSWGGGVLGEYADAGLVQDLSPYLAEDGWGDSISSGAKALFVVNGSNYAVPWRMNMVGMFYNKEMFAEAGIEGTPETWDELLTAVEQLNDAGMIPIAVGEGEQWPGMFWYANLLAKMASPDEIIGAANRTGAFNSEGYVAAGTKLEELVALNPFQEGFLGSGYADAESLMANSGAAMQLMGNWAYGFASGSLAEDVEAYDNYIGWFPFPAVDGGAGDPTTIFGGGDSFAIGVNAPPEAIEFVRYLTSAEAHEMLVISGAVPLPIIDGVAADYPNPLFNDIADQISSANFVLNFLDQQFPPPLNTAVNEEVQKVFAGVATGQEIADNMETLAQDALD